MSECTDPFAHTIAIPSLRRAVKLFKTQLGLAHACGVSQQAISRALATGHVSLELAYKIEAATGSKIKKERLFDFSALK